ncbi:hypothetical protein THAOC_28142 [Thalassiosira oceanica]|uniref:Uncharacterized protein n=1 Tax=Thalassiosira oceanica TaxID=159749 RepID=K0RUN2_THAOC|nr:hypothetical protein THAOC_28142 [Thalassiosira oceanica]|eukprot:EJK52566.1 hypothetical protein THAOC_28142 [Thalassiosira oceanica]
MNRGKRLKTTPSPNELSITDLPTDQLVAVSEYLGKTSSVLFAVALTAPVRSWRTSKRKHGPNKVSRAVIKAAARPAVPPSTESVTAAPWCSPYTQRTHLEEYYNSSNCWELLDFCDIHDVATRLEDVDVRAMLVCIDAKRCLKKLRLPVCQSLRGYGLEELWGSTILEHVDFSHTIQPVPEITRGGELCAPSTFRVFY